VCRYCCLGVGCETAKEELNLDISEFTYDDRHLTSYGGCSNFAPDALVKYLCLFDDMGSCSDKRAKDVENYIVATMDKDEDNIFCFVDLTQLNDHVGLSFNEIATVIRKYPEAYFSESV
jgi:hypothetical protein